MNSISIANSLKPIRKNQLITEGFMNKPFSGLKIEKKSDPDSMFKESWSVLDSQGSLLREFLSKKDAEDYKNYLSNLKLHDVDMLIVSLLKEVNKLSKEIEQLKSDINSKI